MKYNDTIAIVFLGMVALAGIYFKMENIVLAALGAIGGYLGSKVIDNVNK